jgi:type VI secretion system protein ImpH
MTKGHGPGEENSLSKKKWSTVKSILETIHEYEWPCAVHILKQISTEMLNQEGRAADSRVLADDFLKAFGPVHFRSTVFFAPRPTPLERVEIRQTPQGFFQPVLWVNFLGIAGIQGPFALVYTERVFRNIRNKDYAFSSFLDIFNHRFITLYYDQNRWIPGFSSPPPESSALGQILASLAGLTGLEVLEGENKDGQELAHVDAIRYALTYKNLFWKKTRSSAALKQILQSFFKTTVIIQEAQGEFVPILEEEITHIGKSGQKFTLGVDAVLGTRVWRSQRVLQIFFPYMSRKKYEDFNPYAKGPAVFHLRRICSLFIPSSLHVRFWAGTCQKEPLILGAPHALGFNTWLGNQGQHTWSQLHLEGLEEEETARHSCAN